MSQPMTKPTTSPADHHTKAAECCDKAAAEHRSAAKCCGSNDAKKAGEHAKIAQEHGKKAQEHSAHATAA